MSDTLFRSLLYAAALAAAAGATASSAQTGPSQTPGRREPPITRPGGQTDATARISISQLEAAVERNPNDPKLLVSPWPGLLGSK